MTKRNKSLFCVAGIACLLTAIIFTNTAMKKQSVISSMARARYAVNIVNRTASQTNQIPQSLALELVNKIEEGSSVMIFLSLPSAGKKQRTAGSMKKEVSFTEA